VYCFFADSLRVNGIVAACLIVGSLLVGFTVCELHIGKVTCLKVGSCWFNLLCVNCCSDWCYPGVRVVRGSILILCCVGI